MAKRVILGVLLVGLIGVLVAGAIIRTVDKTENVAEAHGQGRGRSEVETVQYVANTQGRGGGGYGRNGGAGQQVESTERLYPNYEVAPEDWATYEGTVVEAPQSDGDLVILTDDGTQVTVGTGPGYMETQGFVLDAGEQVQVQGYWDDDELKAAQVTRLSDGQTVTLRDEIGRPAWAGGGQRATGQTEPPGDGTGTGQAEVDEWLTLEGTVLSVDADALVVQLSGPEQVVVENRPWWFAQELGFEVQPGDSIELTGFYEDGDFEVGQLKNLSSGQVMDIREESGRPLWAGGGRRGSW